MGRFDDLSAHCAIVTGAAGGIGLSFCQELAKRRCALIMIDISDHRLRKAVMELHKDYPYLSAVTLTADLTDSAIVHNLENLIENSNLDPDILINNAGIFSFAPLTEVDEGKVNCFVDLHVRAVTLLSRWMAGRCAAKGKGWILNMSSMSCWMPMPGLSLYAATKAYIRVLTRALHYEVKESGVRVMAACPGGIATDLFGLPDNLKRLALRLGAIATPEKFTRNAINKLMAGKKQYINGFLNRLSIFFVAVTPTPLRMAVKHRLLDKGIKR